MRISDWSSDVCSSDLLNGISGEDTGKERDERSGDRNDQCVEHPFGERRIEYQVFEMHQRRRDHPERIAGMHAELGIRLKRRNHHPVEGEQQYENKNRSEEHTSELQSLMRNSYAVFCLKKKKRKNKAKKIYTDIHNNDTATNTNRK